MSINLATQRLLDDGESSTVEFVRDHSLLEEIASSVCAFLNGKGGTVVVGFDGERTGSAIADSDVTTIRKYLYENVSPNCVMSVTLDEVTFGKVVVIEVPDGRDTPYVFDGRVYLRSGKSIRAADAEEMRQMVLDKGTNVQRWERRPSPTLTIGDLDAQLIKRTVDAAARRAIDFEAASDFESVLQKLDLMSFGQFTNAADVCFGKKVAQRLPQVRLRAVRYELDRMGDFLDDQLVEGPAMEIFKRALNFIQNNVPVSAEFSAGNAERKDIPTFPFNSIREGLINALAHRDYSSFSGSVKINIYPDRLEIWNSGKLPAGLTPKKLEMAHHDSILVNPDISHVLYLNGLMERVGRGTYNIVRECRAAGLKSPEWKTVAEGTRLTFFAERTNLRSEFNERQIALLENTPPEGEFTTPEYHSAFAPGVSDRHARRDLDKLEDFGFLVRRGVGKGTVFVRSDKELP